jgi:NADP-dependent 3-hydroxy acid dehydrogenase YdfG
MENSRDSIAVVTGGGSGIGRALAVALAKAGAKVLIVGRHSDKLEAVVRESADGPGEIRPHPLDLEKPAEIEAFCSDIAAVHGRVDLLVHSAGVYSGGSIAEAEVAELDRHYRVNLQAPYLLTQGLLPLLRRSQGEVVFINSSAIHSPKADLAAYVASKTGLKALADSLRAEENDRGIRVLTLYPGRTATPMQESIHDDEGKPYRAELLVQAGDVARLVLDVIALPRTVEVTDIHLRPFLKA